PRHSPYCSTPSLHDALPISFTIGRGNEVCCAAIEALSGLVIGHDASDLGEFYRRLTHDSQFRWLGPEKGVMHLAAAALVNAAWEDRKSTRLNSSHVSISYAV